MMASVLLIFPKLSKAQSSVNMNSTIRVLTFNILHGATTKGDFNLDVIADVIKRTNPDLVALQEVDFKTNRAKKYDLVTELAIRTQMIPLFGRTMFYDGGEYGEGILSKSTFIKSRLVKLPHLDNYEPRTALEITTIIGSNDTISFIGTHLDHVEGDTNRIMQAKEINRAFSSNKYPNILAGDLNDIQSSNTINILETFWTSAYNKNNYEYTFPSNKPNEKIDYIMFMPKDSWSVLETKAIKDTVASDHCAYFVILGLNK